MRQTPIHQKLEREPVIQIPSVQEQQTIRTTPLMEQAIRMDQLKMVHHYFFRTNQWKVQALECLQILQMQEQVQVVQIHWLWWMIRMPMAATPALEHQNHQRRELVPKRNQIQKMMVQPLVEIQMVLMMPDQMQEFVVRMSQKESRLGLRKETTADQTFCFELGQFLSSETIMYRFVASNDCFESSHKQEFSRLMFCCLCTHRERRVFPVTYGVVLKIYGGFSRESKPRCVGISQLHQSFSLIFLKNHTIVSSTCMLFVIIYYMF
jgi:hypothetical protein